MPSPDDRGRFFSVVEKKREYVAFTACFNLQGMLYYLPG